LYIQDAKQQLLLNDLAEAMRAVATADVQAQAREFASICEEAATAQVQKNVGSGSVR